MFLGDANAAGPGVTLGELLFADKLVISQWSQALFWEQFFYKVDFEEGSINN